MGFSVVNTSNNTTILAEIALNEAQTQECPENEGLTLPQELVDAELYKELAQMGLLKGENKQFSFIREEGAALPQKFQDYLSDINRPQSNKILDPKNPNHSLSFKESFIKSKEFRVLEPHSQNLEKESQESIRSTHYKTDQAAKEPLEKGRAPQSPTQLKESGLLKQEITQSKTLENRLHKEFAPQSSGKSETADKKKEVKEEKHREAQQKRSEREAEILHQRVEKSDERNEQQQRRKNEEQEEGEGSPDHEHNSSQQDKEESSKEEKSSIKIDSEYICQFTNYATENSIISDILKMRVSQLDVLVLFLEILKLEIKGREQERITRREERELQLLHMQKVVDNYKDQGKWTMMTSIGSGVLGIISGICPVLGHMKGDWILQKLGTFFESMRDMKKDQLFKSLTKLTFTMSEMQKSVGQIHNSYSEGNRTYDQQMSDLYRSDWEERTRSIDEIKDSWKGIENFLYQALQMQHEAIRQLYNI